MDLVIVFSIFLICLIAAIIADISLIIPLFIGMLLFSFLAYRKGSSVREIIRMILSGFKDSLIVVEVMILIGCLTGLWRISGTIAYFVNAGISLMPPALFILAAFLLSGIMSYAIGTSFGITATAGVILISIARAGGVPVIPAAGAILSGVYIGDRGSPASSSAALVASVTKTDQNRNIREMLKTAVWPLFLCVVIYGAMSVFFPLDNAQSDLLGMLTSSFNMSWICLVPAVLMIVLPFLKVPVKNAMAVDIVVSFIVAVFVQHSPVFECLKVMLAGYHPENAELSQILSGGGVSSMVSTCVIVLISCTFGSIFRTTGILDGLNEKMKALESRIGRFTVMVLLAIGSCMLFCNQTIGVIMTSNLSDGLYDDSEESRYRKMIEIENSAIVIAGLVPWCIACSVPLAMLDAPITSIFCAFFLWLIPAFEFLRHIKQKRKV